jgi:LysR family cyn operon transcriptional activator
MPSILNDPVELRHLRYFRVVAESGGFTRAAAEIGLSQPTLSQQIHQLETALGVKLLVRGSRACRLTPAGDLVLRHARRVLGDLEALRRSLEDLSGLRRGSLRVAVLPVLARRLLTRVLADFHRDYPEIRLTVLQMTVDEMARALSQGTVELGIGCLGTPLGLKGELLFSEELVAVFAGSDDPSTPPGSGDPEVVSVKELSQRAVIAAPAGYGTRTLMMSAWARTRMPLVVSLEVEDSATALHAVAMGSGPAVLPESALWGHSLSGVRVKRITGPVMRREIGLLLAQGAEIRPAADALIPYLRAAVEKPV